LFRVEVTGPFTQQTPLFSYFMVCFLFVNFVANLEMKII